MPPSVLIVSSDSGLRAMLSLSLTCSLGANVAAETSEWEQAPRLAEDLRSDIVLLDILSLPGECSAIVRQLKAVRPEARVVVLTVSGDETSATAAEASGADRAIDRESFLAMIRHPIAAARVAS